MKVLNKTKRLCDTRFLYKHPNIPQRNAAWNFSGGSSGGWAHGHIQICGTYGLKSRGSLCVLLRKPSNICGFLDDSFHFMAPSTVQHFNRICPVNFPICWVKMGIWLIRRNKMKGTALSSSSHSQQMAPSLSLGVTEVFPSHCHQSACSHEDFFTLQCKVH